MHLVRSDRAAAGLLLAAAVLGLVLAATPIGPALIAARDAPFEALGLHLSADHVIGDGLLAVFFLLIAVELRHELTHGELALPAAAAVPAVAALGGVAVPAGLYLLVAGDAAPGGWPIPTATDIAFALGLLALVGRGLPSRVRAFLLALAVLDDLVAILLIAVVFPTTIAPLPLVCAAAVVGACALVARAGRLGWTRAPLLVVLGLGAWYLAALSGVHATLAGVALGLVLPGSSGAVVDRLLQPVSRAVVLPLFACSASLVRVEDVSVGPVLVAVAIALPVGKLVGIVAGGLLGRVLLGGRAPSLLGFPELAAVGLVGGVGFTVSLLMARLAFGAPVDRDAAVCGVLVGSAAAILLSAALVPLIARPTTRGAE